jgi:hypothetical protein
VSPLIGKDTRGIDKGTWQAKVITIKNLHHCKKRKKTWQKIEILAPHKGILKSLSQ